MLYDTGVMLYYMGAMPYCTGAMLYYTGAMPYYTGAMPYYAGAMLALLTATHFCSVAAAAPLRCASCAMATPSIMLSATLQAASATPAFRLRASATGPRAPPNVSCKWYHAD